MVEKEKATGPFLWVALDGLTEHEDRTLDVAWELAEIEGNFGFKVNEDWILKRGAAAVLAHLPDRPVFADIKTYTSAAVMERAFNVLYDAGFNTVSAYALAGGDTEELGNELRKAIAAFRRSVGGSAMRIYAATILTHYGDPYTQHHFRRSFGYTVQHLAEVGMSAGADGIIMPGTCLSRVSHLDVMKIIPGISADGYPNSHQKQVIKLEALAGRQDVEAVAGESVMGTLNPASALMQHLEVLSRQ